ncbi:DUF6458 family protein [Actinocorallia aurea]
MDLAWVGTEALPKTDVRARGVRPVGFGVAIFVITLGAILKFAVNADLGPVDLNAIGVILMIVGGASFLLQFVFARQLGSEGPPRANGPAGRDTSHDGDD